MDLTFFLLLGCWISWTPVITLGGVALMPNTSLNCPGPIQFTCVGTDIPNTLIWRVNDTDHRGEYAFLPSHTFPRSILLSPSLPGVEVLVINVSISNQFRINIASTLTSAAMVLNGATIQCADGANVNSTVYHIDIIAPPTHLFLECSLVVSPGGVIASFDSFSSENNMTNYRVILSPTPSSCPSEQLVSPSEDYSCSGLVLGTNYSFNVSAINCGNQEGPGSTIIVHPQAPLIPEIEVFATYNDENSLSQLTVTWQVKRLSISDVCSFDNSLNYTIFLEDGRRGRLEETVVNSDSCNNNLCATSFTNFSSSTQRSLVSIYAVNAFGQSNVAESAAIENSLQLEVLNSTLTFEDCVTTLLCSSILAEGPCVVQYSQDSSNFNNHLIVSLNSPSPLPLMDAFTQYYFLFEVRVNSTFYRLRRSFMTGEVAVHLIDTNIGLLIVGVIFLILGIIIVIMWIPLFIKCDTASSGTKRVRITSLILLLVAVFLWLVSVCLWIAVGGIVGPQRNTCDSKWQSNRDNLIIAAFILSFISLLLFITATAVTIYKIKKADFIKDMYQIELEEQENTLDQKFGCAKPSQEPASKCQQCGSKFSIVKWNRPHYCGACGKCFCSACTVNEANLPYDSKMEQKVCDSCYEKSRKKGIQVFGPGPSRFYQPTSQPVPVTSPQMNTPQPLYSTQQAASSQSTENGSTTKLLTKDDTTPEGFVMVKKDSQNQKINGSGGKPAQNTEQETFHARDHTNLIGGTEKGSDSNQDGTTKQPQQKEISQDPPNPTDVTKTDYEATQNGTTEDDERPDENGNQKRRTLGVLVDKVKTILPGSGNKSETPKEISADLPYPEVIKDPDTFSETKTQNGITEKSQEDEPGVFDKMKAGMIDFFSGPKDERPDESGREEQRDQGIIDKQKETSQDPPNPTDVTNTDYETTQNGTAEEDERPDESGNQKQTTLGVLIDKVKIMLPGSGNKSETPKETSADLPDLEDPDTFRELDFHSETKTQNRITEKSQEDEPGIFDKVKAGVIDLFSGPKDERPDESGREERRDQGIIDKQKETSQDPPNPTDVTNTDYEATQNGTTEEDERPDESGNQKQTTLGVVVDKLKTILPGSGNKSETPEETSADLPGPKVIIDPDSFRELDSHSETKTQNGITEKSQEDEGSNESGNQEEQNQGLLGGLFRLFTGSSSRSEVSQTTALFGAEPPELDLDSADVCHVCNTKVTSRVYCRACGKVVCENCSKNKAYLEYYKSTVMVCPHCHEKSGKRGDLQSNEETTV